MKKIFVLVAICLLYTVNAEAQKTGDMAVGGNLVLGTGNSTTNIGIGAKFRYNVTDPIRLEGSFTYFLETDKVTYYDLIAEGHYLFPVSPEVTLYPIVGLGIFMWSTPTYEIWGVKFGGSDSDFGLVIGGGIDYKLNDKMSLNGGIKFKVAGDWNRTYISAGFSHRL